MMDKEKQDLLARQMDRLHRSFPSCLNCDHFNEISEECSLYKVRPPADVIAYSCPAWTEIVPF